MRPLGFKSEEYFAWPLDFACPSSRLMRLPIIFRFSASGQE
jgi:hypothetical protein